MMYFLMLIGTFVVFLISVALAGTTSIKWKRWFWIAISLSALSAMAFSSWQDKERQKVSSLSGFSLSGSLPVSDGSLAVFERSDSFLIVYQPKATTAPKTNYEPKDFEMFLAGYPHARLLK